VGGKVVVKGVVKRYGKVLALKGVSFEAGPGVHSFLGPNGSGKSTLLAIIAGALRPSEGYVEVCGIELWGKEGLRARRLIGYAPQDPPLKPLLTGYENLVYQGLLKGLSMGEAKRRAKELLNLVGLSEAMNRKASEYSGGMRRRYALAVALINDPKVIVLDEPSTGLDPDARRTLWDIMKELAKEDKVVILATHYAEEAERLGDLAYIMYRGEIIVKGSPKELKAKYGPPSKIEIKLKEEKELGGVKGVLEGSGLEWRIISKDTLVLYSQDPYSRIPEITSALLKEGYYVKTVRVEEPTLEDVFFKVTGAELEGEGGGGV